MWILALAQDHFCNMNTIQALSGIHSSIHSFLLSDHFNLGPSSVCRSVKISYVLVLVSRTACVSLMSSWATLQPQSHPGCPLPASLTLTISAIVQWASFDVKCLLKMYVRPMLASLHFQCLFSLRIHMGDTGTTKESRNAQTLNEY